MKQTDQKVMVTVSVDIGTRKLMHKYGGQRGIGRFLSELIRKYDAEEVFGLMTVSSRLDRIERTLTELIDRREVLPNKK